VTLRFHQKAEHNKSHANEADRSVLMATVSPPIDVAFDTGPPVRAVSAQ